MHINAIIKSYPSITCAIDSNLQNPDVLHIPWSWKPSPEGTAYTVQARGSQHSRPRMCNGEGAATRECGKLAPLVEKHVPMEQPASACGGEPCYPAVHMLGKAKQTYIRHHKTLNFVRMSICPFWGSHDLSIFDLLGDQWVIITLIIYCYWKMPSLRGGLSHSVK